MDESQLARRVREQLNDSFDWSTAARVKAWGQPKPRDKSLDLMKLPRERGPAPAGAVGRLVPSRAEAAILREAARRGGFVFVTLSDTGPHYHYADGRRVTKDHGVPLEKDEFQRLAKFLVPEPRDILIEDATPQRWSVRGLAL